MAESYEEEVMKLWRKKKIFEKLKKKNKKGKPYYLMDGPPYATGHIHMGTALNKIAKDVAIRFKRMQGYDVFDRAGYDTHGVPTEFQIEKEIGSKSRRDIEKFGVKKFIEKCKEYATRYIDVMNKEFENLGVWMNFSDPYLTLSDSYIEAVWWTFKKAEEKGLLYLGKYPVHVCPRCETAVAYNEIIYKKIKDNSVFVKFPVKNEKNKFLVIWTTTPWTLPGNTGIMVHPDYDYAEVQVTTDNGNEIWVVAKESLGRIMPYFKLDYKITKILKGRELENLEYINPLSKNLALNLKNAYYVVLSSRYVGLEEGTGLVHCAPGHGKEDYDVGKEYGLDMPSPVLLNGLLTEEAGKYAGKKARLVDEEIVKDLKQENALIYTQPYEHDYPICWRCKEPLLMLSVPQWFFKIKGIQDRMLKLNEETNWVPSWMEARMKAWLEGIGDWPISRQRYWGTPLPIWLCEKCGKRKVIGSIKELKKAARESGIYSKINLHKPDIDKIKLKCECRGKMKRVTEVLDVWFDSGVSSWAALGYPAKKNLFERFWPADLNIEATDQIRGWWNSQIITSTICFDEKPFKNVMVHGMVLDIGKKKMSKSLGNAVSPQDVIYKHGRDYLRYYLVSLSNGNDMSFDERALDEAKKFFTILKNTNNFILGLGSFAKKGGKSAGKIEDRWILSRLNSLIKQVTESYEKLEFFKVCGLIENFAVNELSRTYIQLIRERASNDDRDVINVLNDIMLVVLRLIAPIIPFLSDHIYQQIINGNLDSIHLSSWPKADEKKIDKGLEKQFEVAMKLIETGLAARDKEKIGLKWPLAKATVTIENSLSQELQDIVARQLNVKKIETKKGKEIEVELDTKITAELEAEGYARELARKIQAERKNAGLQKENKIELAIQANKDFLGMLEKQKDFIQKRTNASKLILSEKIDSKGYKNKADFKVKEKKGCIYFNKI